MRQLRKYTSVYPELLHNNNLNWTSHWYQETSVPVSAFQWTTRPCPSFRLGRWIIAQTTRQHPHCPKTNFDLCIHCYGWSGCRCTLYICTICPAFFLFIYLVHRSETFSVSSAPTVTGSIFMWIYSDFFWDSAEFMFLVSWNLKVFQTCMFWMKMKVC